VRQEELDRLHAGITIEGIRYGSIEARLEREQGANAWLTFAMREGKNREVKNVLGHLGLSVNRLIRVSFGPFQLGDLPEGAVEEVKTRVLRDQLGDRIAALSGADFSAPIVARVLAAGEEASAERSAAARPPARPAAAQASKRRPERHKRRRDAERFGEPELARRDQRRGRGPDRGKRPGR
jgi:23S rRNA pseudouridine2605 synthase